VVFEIGIKRCQTARALARPDRRAAFPFSLHSTELRFVSDARRLGLPPRLRQRPAGTGPVRRAGAL
jgi:hypothetical protein